MRNALLTATKGMAVMHTNFAEYGPWCGDLAMRDNGSLLSFDTGPSTSYALDSIQARGKLFIGPGEEIYKGQVCPPVHCVPSVAMGCWPVPPAHPNHCHGRCPVMGGSGTRLPSCGAASCGVSSMLQQRWEKVG